MVVYTLEQRGEGGLRSTCRICPFWEKIIFSDEAHFDLGVYVNKQNCRIWGTENLHWKADAPKTNHCLVRILVQRHNLSVTVNGDRYRAMLKEFLFTKIEEQGIGHIWFQQPALRSTQPKLCSMFWALFFWRSHYQPHSWCRLATSDLRLDTVGLLIVGWPQR